MGRGVSTPKNTIHAVYFDVTWMGEVPEVDDMGEIIYNEDGTYNVEYDEWVAKDEWNCWLEYDIKTRLVNKYGSLYEVSKWLGREDQAILANNHCYIGVSEYMSVACVWMVNRHDFDGAYGSAWKSEMALAQAWCERVGESFRTVLQPDLVHMGGFSNGEQVYRRVE